MQPFLVSQSRGFLRHIEVAARVVSILAILFFTSFPGRVLAFEHERKLASQHLAFIREANLDSPRVAGIEVESPSQTRVPKEGVEFTVTASAYSSTVAETDRDPFTTASGTHVHLGTLAANFLPLGAIVRIEGQVYTVEDRMNSRFDGEYRIDIWMVSPDMAAQFGVRQLSLEIIRLP